MRRLPALLLAVGLPAAVSACGADQPPPTATAAPTGVPSMPPSYPPPSSGEVPGGLPFGERNLTGVVERSGSCTMLRVGERLWSLTGTPVTALQTGAEVAVSGQVTTPDPACATDVTRGLVVHRATPV
ncbi:hypothetical protein AB0M02_34025 [Actinoplanes sp. NPDC051861]|uniref:hypothetical protein n=1 Tax=Actinoplanes sp. NPDC051861 TaxID=3155170 RepID=UPI0034377F51